MKLASLNHYVCIDCFSPLSVEPGYAMDPERSQEIYSGTLTCTSCKRNFPVIWGVPRFVDQAKSSATDIYTGSSFAKSWKQFPGIDERYEKQFYDWVSPVDREFLKDKLVLECGCGKGRHAKIISEAGVSNLFAVDIGEAIDVAYKNVGHLPNVHLCQADIEHMPFKRVFDYGLSVGVLHHMAYPIKGFLALSSKIVETGSVSAWVYGRENNWWLIRIVNPIRIAVTSKMPSQLLLVLCGLIAVPLFLYCKLVAQPWASARIKNPSLPHLYYGEYLSYIAQFGYTEIHSITFDHLIAPVANYVSKEYFGKWFEEAGWPDWLVRWHNRNSWCGFGSGTHETMEKMRAKISHLEAFEVHGREILK